MYLGLEQSIPKKDKDTQQPLGRGNIACTVVNHGSRLFNLPKPLVASDCLSLSYQVHSGVYTIDAFTLYPACSDRGKLSVLEHQDVQWSEPNFEDTS